MLHKVFRSASTLSHLPRYAFSQYDLVIIGGGPGETVQKKKNQIVTGLTSGIKGLFQKNKAEYVAGFGKLVDANTVSVESSDGSGTKTLQTKNIIIATGSDAIPFPNLPFDEKTVVSSTGALSFDSIPESLVIIGGGIIGLELGQVYQRFGTKVTVIEFLDRIVAVADQDMSKALHKILTKQGMVIHTGHKVTKGVNNGDHAEITFEPVKGGPAQSIKATKVLVATGRRPYSDALNAKEIGIRFDNKNRVIINEHFQTNYANIYAIGDIVAGPMLAHKAEEEAIAAVEYITGRGGHINYNTIPSVIYSHPEVAWVGATEEELKAKNASYRKGSFPFLANSRAKAIDDTDGLIKVLADKETDKLLGVHIIGPGAGEMIAEAVIGMEYGASSEDIGRVTHAHPTLSEALKEACMATFDKSIHF